MNKQRGFTLIELLVSLVIAGVLIGGLLRLVANDADRKTQAIAAQQQATYANALYNYQVANASTLLASTGPSTPATVTTAQLIAGNYLDSSFSDTTVYGQTLVARVIQTVPGKLDPIVLSTGGPALTDVQVHGIAAYLSDMKANGGFIDSRNGTQVVGVGGWWARPTSAYGVNPGVGHVASGVFVKNTFAGDDYLHRTANANPQLNTMSTTLLMAGNAMTGVSNIRMNAGNQGMTFYGGGEQLLGTTDFGISMVTGSIERFKAWNDGHFTMNGPVLLPGNGNMIGLGNNWLYGDSVNMALRVAQSNGTVFLQGPGGAGAANLNVAGLVTSNGYYVNGASGVYWSAYGKGWYMQDGTWMRCYADCSIFTNGQVQAGSIQSNGTITSASRITSNEYIAVAGLAAVGSGCNSGGTALLARANDGTNQFLMCKNNVWSRMGGYSTFVQIWGPQVYRFNSDAVCPTGYQLISGGYQAGWQNGANSLTGQLGGGFFFGVIQGPDLANNKWSVATTTNFAWAQATAICAQ